MEPHSGFTNLDYIVIGIVLFSGLLALMRGFVREIFSLIAWAGAYFAATKFYPLAMPFVHHYIKSDKAVEWASMAAVFTVTLIILVILGSIVCSFIKGNTLTAIDRSLGFVFGLARGVLVVCIIYLVATIVLWPDLDKVQSAKAATEDEAPQQQEKGHNAPPDFLVQAKTRPLVAYGANVLKALIPEKMLDGTLKNAQSQVDALTKDKQQKALDMLSTPTTPAGNSPTSHNQENEP